MLKIFRVILSLSLSNPPIQRANNTTDEKGYLKVHFMQPFLP